VGAHALASHGFPRATGDLEIWVRPDPANAKRVRQALASLGAPISDLIEEDLCRPRLVLQIGLEPWRIDILTTIDGVDFEEAWQGSGIATVEGMQIRAISREHLIRNKRATGRPKDLGDVAWLESQSSPGTSPGR
jgi:hypothetical protein